MLNKEFSTVVRVYIEDTDAGGVVYYVNYLKFMERARTEFLRNRGVPKPALLTDDLLMVVASAQIDYKRSAVLDDELRVTASLEKRARSYLLFNQTIWRDEELIAQGQVKVACVSKHSMRPAPFPNFFNAALADVGE